MAALEDVTEERNALLESLREIMSYRVSRVMYLLNANTEMYEGRVTRAMMHDIIIPMEERARVAINLAIRGDRARNGETE